MVTNSEVWMGSGASVTLVPESDLFLGYVYGSGSGLTSATTSTDLTKGQFQLALTDTRSEFAGDATAGVTFAATYLLVEDLYTGCIVDFYDGSNNLIISRVISGNNSNTLFFNETYANSSLTKNCYLIIRKFGTPVVGPIRADASGSTNQPTLLADNWMGIVNTITFPNPSIEVLQKNLALGGSRNFTFQFKGMENADGGSFEVSANQGTWLYYALGKCSSINATFTDTSEVSSNFVGADSSNDFLLDAGLTAATATLTVTDGDAANGMTAAQKIHIISSDGTKKDYFISDNNDGGPATGAVVAAGDTLKSTGSVVAGSLTDSDTTGVAIGLNLGADTQATMLADLKAAIEHANGHNGKITVSAVSGTGDGNQTITLTQVSTTHDALGNTTITENIDNLAKTNFTGGTLSSGAFLEQGPIFYRKIGTTICPPITKGDFSGSGAQNQIEKLTEPTESSGSILNAITYTFGEANGSDLPSFTLEHVIEKGSPTQSLLSDGSDQTYSTTADDAADKKITLRVSDEVFSRIATGNTVNTLTLMANEGEELKMSMDLMTKQIVRPQSNDTTSDAGSAYFARRGVTDERDLINFGSAAGGANNSVEGFLKPFFFHDGSLSIFGQQFLKISNFTLTINNNLQEKRFVGNYKKGSKSILPAQRMYEITLSGLVTDSLLFDQLLNEAENPSTSGQMIELTFTKENGENITLKFTDYFVSAANFPIPEDNSPFIVDATIMPRTLNTCTVKTHWLLQG